MATGASAALIGFGIASTNSPLDPLGYGLLVWGGFVALSPLTVAVHEASHAAIAAALGRRIHRISIGADPTLMTFRIGQTLLVIGRNLAFGHVVHSPATKGGRWSTVAILAAGGAGNFAAATGLTALADRLSALSSIAAAFIAGPILSNLITGVRSLIPGSHVRDGLSRPSDGRQILRTLRARPPPPLTPGDLRLRGDAWKGWGLIEAKLWSEAEAHYRTAIDRHPSQPGFVGSLLHVLAASGQPEAARSVALVHEAALLRRSETAASTASIWSYDWSMAAWTLLRSQEADLCAADRLSRLAIAVDPGSPYAGAVNGAVQTRTGKSREGLAVILAKLKDLGSPANKLEFIDFIVAEHLETAELKAEDFRAYAAHLRSLVAPAAA